MSQCRWEWKSHNSYSVIPLIFSQAFEGPVSKAKGQRYVQTKWFEQKKPANSVRKLQIIAELNQELLDKNLFTQEDFPERLELAQSYINESHRWEELGDQNKSYEALTTANMIIVEISAVIKHILYQDTSANDSNLQMDQTSA